MKVLMLADSYPPFIGGGERHVQSLSRELTRRGHEVIVCTIGGRELSRYEDEDSVKVHRFEGLFQKIPFLYKDPVRKKHPPAQDWIITRKLAHIIKQERPDIIHVHGRMLYSALPLKRGSEIPLLVTLHDYALFCPTTGLTKKNNICDKPFTKDCIACGRDKYGLVKSLAAYYGVKTNKNKLKSVDKFIAVSSFVRQVYAKHLGLSDKDVLMIPNFYSPEAESKSEKGMELPEDFILFVGALAPHKGVNLLIEAYYKLNAKTKLVMIGGKRPDYRYESTEDILVIEDAPHDIVMQAMSRCRFAVFPSICAEAFGIVVLEAMSQKKAVIASDIGGLKDVIIDSQTGILVPPNNSDKLAEAISHLLQSPERASEMAQKGYERFMKNYTPEAVVPMIIDVYQGLK
ncbi:MAG TPA: glycosyltransferase family 4 protein [Dehalococcoidia bacterium]|nr:glycosyltransferase family 4 protein [Dehalococcoidia bacterium]